MLGDMGLMPEYQSDDNSCNAYKNQWDVWNPSEIVYRNTEYNKILEEGNSLRYSESSSTSASSSIESLRHTTSSISHSSTEIVKDQNSLIKQKLSRKRRRSLFNDQAVCAATASLIQDSTQAINGSLIILPEWNNEEVGNNELNETDDWNKEIGKNTDNCFNTCEAPHSKRLRKNTSNIKGKNSRIHNSSNNSFEYSNDEEALYYSDGENLKVSNEFSSLNFSKSISLNPSGFTPSTFINRRSDDITTDVDYWFGNAEVSHMGSREIHVKQEVESNKHSKEDFIKSKITDQPSHSVKLEIHPSTEEHNQDSIICMDHNFISNPVNALQNVFIPNPDDHLLDDSLNELHKRRQQLLVQTAYTVASQTAVEILNIPCFHSIPPCKSCIIQHCIQLNKENRTCKIDGGIENFLLFNPSLHNCFYRLPRCPTARAAIHSYPYPPLPVQHLPKFRHHHQQSLFDGFLTDETSPLRIQLGHFIVEHCIRSIPECYLRPDGVTPDPRIIADFVDQIIWAVKIFAEHANEQNFNRLVEPIPTDINEAYIARWLQENRNLLKPLEQLHCGRNRKFVVEEEKQEISAEEEKTTRDEAAEEWVRSIPLCLGASSLRSVFQISNQMQSSKRSYFKAQHRQTKAGRKIGVSLGQELDRLRVPRFVHYANLKEALVHRGIVVQLPSNGHSYHSPRATMYESRTASNCSEQNNNFYQNYNSSRSPFNDSRLLFNLLIAGRGDTRRTLMDLPWRTTAKIKYNRTLLGIPQFVVEGLGYGNNKDAFHHLIPKVCAVSLEDTSASCGIEVLLFYRGLQASKRLTSHKRPQPQRPRHHQSHSGTGSKVIRPPGFNLTASGCHQQQQRAVDQKEPSAAPTVNNTSPSSNLDSTTRMDDKTSKHSDETLDKYICPNNSSTVVSPDLDRVAELDNIDQSSPQSSSQISLDCFKHHFDQFLLNEAKQLPSILTPNSLLAPNSNLPYFSPCSAADGSLLDEFPSIPEHQISWNQIPILESVNPDFMTNWLPSSEM